MVSISHPMAEARSIILVLLSITLLPISLIVTLLAHVTSSLPADPKPAATISESNDEKQHDQQQDARRRAVLVTGVGMAKGLTLARAFHLCGHRVIGADFENSRIPCPGRYSQSLTTFYPLVKPCSKELKKTYIRRLVKIVETEKVDIWVSCSGVASAMEDATAKELIEVRSLCRCIQFDAYATSMLHDKGSFMDEAKRLGLPVPETYNVASPDDILKVLSSSISPDPNRRFILKPVDVDDAHRGDMTLLPCLSLSETKARISKLPISSDSPWILQQFIPGGEEYCTHALVVHGVVKCFVACPSAELLMHYKAIPPTSALFRAMLAFTREFIARSCYPVTWTGHLSFDFMVKDGAAGENGFDKQLYAIECNPRAHTSVVLFNQYGPEMIAMVKAYMSAASAGLHEDMGSNEMLPPSDIVQEPLVVTPITTMPRYWIGHDLVSLVLHRAWLVVTGHRGFRELLAGCRCFVVHVATWKEGTFDAWDPWPAFMLYHVYWPLTILSAWWHGSRWSRINVSTTKMFAR